MNYSYTTDATMLGSREQDRSSTFNSVVNQYAIFNERPSVMFDTNAIHSPPILNEDNNNNSMMLIHPMNPIPTSQHFQNPWSTMSEEYSTHASTHNVSPSERGIAGFVSKLYQCLQSPESNHKYARWCQHEGKDMFVIDCIPEFTEIVLPRLFKHCKFASFVRQLNIYGFQRDTDARKSKDTKEKESCRWYHPYFRPNHRELFHLIRRKATRYSRKSKAKASPSEEDPETILNVGSGDDESVEMDQENMVLIVHDDHTRRSSSISSVNSMLPTLTDYSSTSQLQPGFSTSSEPVSSSPTAASPSLMHHMPLDSSFHSQVLGSELADLSQTKPDEEMLLGMPSLHQNQPLSPFDCEQDVRLQIYQMKQKHDQECKDYEGQLQKALIQIDEQKLHIQQLEQALGFTKHSVKQSTIHPTTGGYMATCTTIPSFHRDYVQLNHPSSPTIPHRINPLYNKATIRPDHQQHDTNFYFQENLNNDIVQIKNKNNILLSSPILVPSNPVHPSPPVSSWTTFPKYSVDYTHRDSLTGDATLTSNTNGIVTAGSSTADSIVKAEELKSANMVYSVDSKENAKRSSIDMHHSMNFANYM